MWKPVTGNLWSTKGKGSKRGKGEQGAAMRRPGKRRRNLDNLFQDKNSKTLFRNATPGRYQFVHHSMR